jgi:hypothetical protein
MFFLIIFIPYRYKISGYRYETYEGKFSIYPLLGLFGIIFSIREREENNLTIKFLGLEKDLEIKKTEKKKFEIQNIFEAIKKERMKTLTEKSNIQDILKGIRRILKNIKPRKLFLDFKIGFNDPMWTGLLFAALPPMFLKHNHSIRIEPVFNEEIYEGEVEVEGKIWIPIIIIEIIRFFSKKPLRNIISKT